MALGTDLFAKDTDGDYQDDGSEIFTGTDPLSAASFFMAESITAAASSSLDLRWFAFTARTYSVVGYPKADDSSEGQNASNLLQGVTGEGWIERTIQLPNWTSVFISIQAE